MPCPQHFFVGIKHVKHPSCMMRGLGTRPLRLRPAAERGPTSARAAECEQIFCFALLKGVPSDLRRFRYPHARESRPAPLSLRRFTSAPVTADIAAEPRFFMHRHFRPIRRSSGQWAIPLRTYW